MSKNPESLAQEDGSNFGPSNGNQQAIGLRERRTHSIAGYATTANVVGSPNNVGYANPKNPAQSSMKNAAPNRFN